MKNLTGIDHPAIAAENLESLAQWYSDVVGYSKHYFDEQKRVWILRGPDGTFIEMMQKDDHDRQQRTVLTPGLSHLAFRVDDLSVAIKALEAAGVRWIGEIVGAIGGGKLRSFEDPEGNMLQVVQR